MERKILFKCESGSHLYGLSTPTSDKDFVSIFMPNSYDLLSLQKCETIDNSSKKSSEERRNTQEDVDDISYSLSRYLHLVLQGNPNLTEILFSPDSTILKDSSEFHFIRKDLYKDILSIKVYNSFMGFSISQQRKLEYKKNRYSQLCEAISLLENKYSDFILDKKRNNMSEALAKALNSLLKNYKNSKNFIESFHKGLPTGIIYDKLVNERDTYGWRLHTNTFEKLGYDVKFASHALRLLVECEELLLTGKLTFPFTGESYKDIMSVKKGEVPLKEFYKLSEAYENKCRKAKEKTILKNTPNWNLVNSFLVNVLEKEIQNSNKEKDTPVFYLNF
jgi:uncharacterized protein